MHSLKICTKKRSKLSLAISAFFLALGLTPLTAFAAPTSKVEVENRRELISQGIENFRGNEKLFGQYFRDGKIAKTLDLGTTKQWKDLLAKVADYQKNAKSELEMEYAIAFNERLNMLMRQNLTPASWIKILESFPLISLLTKSLKLIKN